jgi:hypothetical protein
MTGPIQSLVELLPPEALQQARDATVALRQTDAQLRERWRQANHSNELRTLELLRAVEPGDVLAAFHPAQRPDLTLVAAQPTPYGWRLALNPPGGVAALADGGAQVPGAVTGVLDTSPFPQRKSAAYLQEQWRRFTDAADRHRLAFPSKPPALKPHEVHNLLWEWPAEMARVEKAQRTRVVELAGPDAGYGVDCSPLRAPDQLTQLLITQGACRVQWGTHTQGAYVVVGPHAQSRPQTLAIPAARCPEFRVWTQHRPGQDKAAAVALYLEGAGHPQRSNLYIVGASGSTPMAVTAPLCVEVVGDTDHQLGKSYRRTIPLFEPDPSATDGLLILRPPEQIVNDVKAAPAELHQERQRDREAAQARPR